MNIFVKSFVFPFVISLIIFSFMAFALAGPTINLIFFNDSSSNADGDTDDSANNAGSANALKAPGKGNLTLVLIGTDEIVYDDSVIPDEDSQPTDSPVDPDTDIGADTDLLPEVDPNRDIKDEFGALEDKFRITPTHTVDFLTVISIDSASGKTVITAIPAETQVYVNNVYASMNEVLYYIQNSLYGLDYGYFAEYVNAVTGCRVDYYAYIDTDDYVKVADKLGRIPVTLDESARKFNESGTIEYIFAEGDVSLSSRDLKNIIKHDGFTSVLTKTSVLSQVSQYVLDKTTTTGYYINFEEKFKEITSLYYNTNVDYESFEKDIPLYFSYSFFTPNRLNPIGDISTVNGASVFTINSERTINLFKQK